MRKMMTKEVTKTTIKVAKMIVEDGAPKAQPLEDEILLGNVSQEKAQKHVAKKHGEGAVVFGVEADTTIYELPVEEFIKIATIKVEDQLEAELPEQA